MKTITLPDEYVALLREAHTERMAESYDDFADVQDTCVELVSDIAEWIAKNEDS